MSTHLKVLPKLRSTDSRLREPTAGKENADSNTVGKRSRTQSESRGIGETDESFLCKSDESDKPCQTPESDANKIPETLTCPPAPRKPIRRALLSCKRKLMPEFDFFETDRREQVDEFFRSSFVRTSAASARRKVAATATATAAESSTSSSSSSSPLPYNYAGASFLAGFAGGAQE